MGGLGGGLVQSVGAGGGRVVRSGKLRAIVEDMRLFADVLLFEAHAAMRGDLFGGAVGNGGGVSGVEGGADFFFGLFGRGGVHKDVVDVFLTDADAVELGHGGDVEGLSRPMTAPVVGAAVGGSSVAAFVVGLALDEVNGLRGRHFKRGLPVGGVVRFVGLVFAGRTLAAIVRFIGKLNGLRVKENIEQNISIAPDIRAHNYFIGHTLMIEGLNRPRHAPDDERVSVGVLGCQCDVDTSTTRASMSD